MDRKKRIDRITDISRNGTLEIPIGHYALVNSHKNNGATKMAIYGLGSCIALILYDIEKTVYAMSHILLAKASKSTRANPHVYPHKYADYSVKELLQDLLRYGAKRKTIRAALVGGSNIFLNNSLEIGTQITKEVKAQLAQLSVKVERELVGGIKGRVLIYDIIENSISVKITGENNFTIYKLK